MTRTVLFVLASSVLMACGGSVAASPDDAGARDVGLDTAPVVDSGAPFDSTAPFDTSPPLVDADPGACNGLANLGAPVDETNVPAPMPTLAGGTSIPSGTYVVVKSERYTGPGGAAGKTGNTLAETLAISPGIVQAVVASNGGPNEATTTSYSIVSGMMRVNATCGAGTDTAPSIDLSFEVVGPTLRLGVSFGGANAVLTFQKI